MQGEDEERGTYLARVRCPGDGTPHVAGEDAIRGPVGAAKLLRRAD
ncbi:MAG: hypothetical protein ACM309_07870 [Bacillota bacterium]